MHTENPSINDGTQRHEIEDLTARLPYGSVSILLEALFIETIHLCNLTRLVIPTH